MNRKRANPLSTASPAPGMMPRFAWNTVTKWCEGLLGAGLAFVVVRLLLEQLGTEAYALSELVSGLVAFSLVAQLGLRHALGRHLAGRLAASDTARVNELFSTALAVYAALAALLAAGFFLAAPWLVDWLGVTDAHRPEALLLLRWFAGPMAALSLLEPAFGAVLFAAHRFDLLNFAHIVELLLRGASIFGLVGQTRLGLQGWGAAMLMGAAAATLLTAYWAWRACPSLSVHPRWVRRDAFVELYTLGGYVFLRENVTLLGQRTDPLVLAWFLGAASVAWYRPGVLLASAIAPFHYAVIRQVTPLAAGYLTLDDRPRVQDLLIRGTRLSSWMGAGTSLALFCLGESLLRLWLGTQFQPAEMRVVVWVLWLWAARDLLHYAGGMQWPVLLGIHRVTFAVLFQLGLAVVNLLASVALVAWLKHTGWDRLSVVGVVIPTVLCGLVEKVVLTQHTARAVGLPVGQYVRQAYLRPLLLTLAAVPVAWWVGYRWNPATWPAWLAAAGVLAALWWIAGWWLVFDATDRARFRRALGPLRKGSSRSID